MIETTKGIVLSNLRYSDTSLILKIFTLEYGKISLIAKGALGAKSKYGSSIQPLSYSDLHFYKKTTGLSMLSKSEFAEYFPKIMNDYRNMSFAMAMIEAINLTQEENAPNEGIFTLAIESLRFLNSGAEPLVVYFAFLFNLCEIMGFAMDLDVANQRPWYYFSFQDGRVIQESFFGKKFAKISDNQLTILKKIQNGEPKELFKLRVYDVDKKIINTFFADYLSYHLEKSFYINSIDLIL
jgi:DNA repair protein RecO (recombination protein O)